MLLQQGPFTSTQKSLTSTRSVHNPLLLPYLVSFCLSVLALPLSLSLSLSPPLALRAFPLSSANNNSEEKTLCTTEYAILDNQEGD